MKEINLTELEIGKKGTVVKLLGGQKMKSKVESLGIIIGCEIKKVSSHMLRGPTVIKVGNSTQAAIGHGMAKKIIVSVK